MKELLISNQQLRSDVSVANSSRHEIDLERRTLLTENQDLRETISNLRTELLIKDERLRKNGGEEKLSESQRLSEKPISR